MLQTWRRHNPNAKIVLVNDTNVREIIPDLPGEWDQIESRPTRSDIIRAGAIFHNGGLYMDTGER